MKAQSASNQVFMGFYWWHLGIVIIGVITFYPNSAVAQITPDATLPNNSNVNSVNKTFNINGGSQAGGNLFHSFKDFSVPTGWEAFFNNGADIQNIISRVTGKSISNIDGLIKANGSANLFLMNPSGIVFGENARLDIGGSFIGTSADSMKFSDGSEFSATNPQSKPLLTINVPMGLQYGTNPGSIQVRGNGQGARNFYSPIIDTQDALRVEADKTLALVGGDIKLEGATLKTAGGRIELGSVSGNGLVGLTPINKGFSLDYGGVDNFGDIQLSQQANVNASGEGAGDIQVQGKRVTLTDAQIETSTLGAKPGGGLVVNATQLVEIGLGSRLQATVYPEATGDGGDLTIKTRQLLLKDGAQIGAGTFGAGNGGNLNVTADESIEVTGTSAEDEIPSGLFASSEPEATGDAGDLTIQTRQLLVQDGARVSAATRSAGKAGNLNVTADDSIQLTGLGSTLSASSEPEASGDAGDLTIQTRQLLLKDEAQVIASTFGEGKGGNLNVTADDSIQLTGYSGLFTSSESEATGDAGDLTIQTRQLLVRKGAQVSAATRSAGKGGNLNVTADESIQLSGFSGLFTSSFFGSGDAGDLTIKTRQLLVQDGAQVSSDTRSAGKGGNLNVTADDSIQVIGRSVAGVLPSSLSTSSGFGSGDAGDLTIKTRQLLVQDGAQVSADTRGAGKGGNLNVTADDSIQVIGTFADGKGASRLSTLSFSGSGDAGDLTIQTRQLLAQDGGQIAAATFGAGNGGNLNVTADDRIQIIGRSAGANIPSGLFTSSQSAATGNAGDLNIATKDLLIKQGGASAESLGQGNAGTLNINANSIRLDNNAILTASTRSVNKDPNKPQANIKIDSQDIILRGESYLTANAEGENVIGGNINIDSGVLAVLENSRISANSTDSRGGRVKINTQGLYGTQPWYSEALRGYITATGATPDLSGTVQINTQLDPISSLTELPVNLVDASNQISNACNPGSREFQNTFVSTGRGGLPMNPTQPLQENSSLSTWVKLKPQPQNSAPTTIKPSSTTDSNISNSNSKEKKINQIVEATGWIVDRDGNIEFVAQANQINSKSPWQTPASCSVSR